MATDDLILCRSDFGDGGWSLHDPAAPDDDGSDILLTGPAQWDEDENDWTRPNAADYAEARVELARRHGG